MRPRNALTTFNNSKPARAVKQKSIEMIHDGHGVDHSKIVIPKYIKSFSN
jgi:hypothetical protein